MEKILSQQQLQNKTDKELADYWQSLTGIFKSKNHISSNQPCVVGFLQLSRETKRRGLELVETKFGKIILQQQKEPI